MNHQNGNMFQKSVIQRIMEFNTTLTYFKKSLTELLEKYDIKNNTFSFVGGKLNDVSTGYFLVEAEKDNLSDIIKEVKDFSMCVRIVENTKFQVGHVYDMYSKINESNKEIIDLETGNRI